MRTLNSNQSWASILAVLLFAATASSSAFADDVREMMEAGLKTVEADLKLSAEQKAKNRPDSSESRRSANGSVEGI